MKQMALILQGGGALGAFEFGVVTELVEQGWQPKAVTGVSIGAINAAAIAGARGGDISASLHTIWDAITLPQVPFLPPSQQGSLSLLGNPNFWRSRTDYLDLARWTSFCDTAPLLTTLNQYLDFNQIRNPGHMRVAFTATDLQTGGPTTFSNYLSTAAHDDTDSHVAVQDDLTARHVLASGSLPPGFPSTTIGGRDYWDGGLFSNTPIDALLNLLEPDEVASLPIFVVDLFPTDDQPAPANMVEVQTRALALQYQNRFWAEFGGNGKLDGFIQMLDTLSDLVTPQQMSGSPERAAAFDWLLRLRALKNLHVIQSTPAAAGGDHDFSRYGVEQRYEAGREAVAKHLAQREGQQGALRVAA